MCSVVALSHGRAAVAATRAYMQSCRCSQRMAGRPMRVRGRSCRRTSPAAVGANAAIAWQIIQHLDEHSGWLHSPASRAVSHAEAAASVARANREAAAAAAAVCDDSSDDGDDAAPRLRCCINGCRWQLLSCSGRKTGGCAVGCAEESHYLCAPCLYTWLASETSLRADSMPWLQRADPAHLPSVQE